MRRTLRKTKYERIKEENEKLRKCLETDDRNRDLAITSIIGKGRGIKALKTFKKGDFVVEYAGELIDIETAKDLETKYSMDASKGCYMYYFKHEGKQYW